MSELTLTSIQRRFLIEVLEDCDADFQQMEVDFDYWSKVPIKIDEALKMLRPNEDDNEVPLLHEQQEALKMLREYKENETEDEQQYCLSDT